MSLLTTFVGAAIAILCAAALWPGGANFGRQASMQYRSQSALTSSVTGDYPPPGKLVDIGGWRLHLNCTGARTPNGPTVVLESGSGDFSFDWSLVQPEVARFARVCSYDRAGSAWSDLGPTPRTMKQITYELHTALTKAGETGPYLLAGQSIGGLLIRSFQAQYPKEVSGMVLVDSTHEDNQLFMNGKVQRMRDLSQGRTIPPVKTAISDGDRSLSPTDRKQIEDFLKQMGPPKIEAPYSHLPPDIQQIRLWAVARPEHYAADNDPFSPEEFAEMYANRKTIDHPLRDIPLIVLTRGKREYPDNDLGKKLDEERKRMQLDLVSLSTNSRQIVATTSGHHIHLDDPQLVVDAIRQVLDAAHGHKNLAGEKFERK
jgi:pimeloyl-ACP methyl ester carboxylesterase